MLAAVGPRHYIEVLDFVHTQLLPRTYVEVGVNRGRSMALALPGTAAVGIDPAPRVQRPVPRSAKVFRATSDDFFDRHDLDRILGGPVDVGFIDGMHLFEFALRDFINLERHCTPDSVVLVHDCYPRDEATAGREPTPGCWSGDIWKLAICLRQQRPDLEFVVLDASPSGLGIATGLDPDSTVLAERYEEICSRYVELEFDYLADGRDQKLGRVAADWEALRGLLPERPYRRGFRPILKVGRRARRWRKRAMRSAKRLRRSAAA